MCGVVGYLSTRNAYASSEGFVERMADAIRYRGPDDGGIWADEYAGIALGHRRLSIQDLSPEGHQPMASASGRYVIVFNGEVYDFLDLKKELETLGYAFRGHSDTEVMLAAVEQWGLDKAVSRFVGMFAFALWDKADRVLHLARDRMGEKPLYYGWQGDAFLFASELKAMRAHPSWQGEIDRDALALLVRHNYIPAPHTIYRGIHKLMPGTILSLSGSDAQPGYCPHVQPYWSVREVAEDGVRSPLDCSDREAVDQLDGMLRSTIRNQMISDVPLGAFLSGGIDSSAVVAAMQAESTRPVRTFSIGFHEKAYNEAEHAKAVAQHLGTEHTELYVTPEQAMAAIPKLPQLYDEPFSDSSQIPTYLVSAMTKQHVTVALSGDGGDELFGGYNRYFLGRSLWHRMRWLPLPLRQALARGIVGVSPGRWDALLSIIPERVRPAHLGDRLHKLAGVLAVRSPEALYRGLVSHWGDPSAIVRQSSEPSTALSDRDRWAALPDFAQRMMYLDMMSYLPDDILVKVDRAAMGVSLETRVPFLDHRLVEFAWRVPLHMKIRHGQGKWLLRQMLYRYVPQALVERPKMGFGIPLDSWLRGPLREWAEHLLDQRRLDAEGFFDPEPILEKWREHLSGQRNWQYLLWDILMFQAWLEAQ